MDWDQLKRWFLRHKRNLPWRENRTPYRVWVSEVMLQQTQVSVVLNYYTRWMEHFPTLEALALAPLEQVMKLWEGLGYYSRARRLHIAAQYIMRHYSGELPHTEELLKKIPGFGPYTTAAVLSFAYHKKKAAVDGNVLRVIARYQAIAENISDLKAIARIRENIQESLPEQESWVFMEALIEFGALVCKKKPLCSQCPIRFSCRAYETQATHLYPIKNQPPVITKLYREVFIIQCGNFVLLYQENKKGRVMEGLWQFPYFEFNSTVPARTFPQALAQDFFSLPQLEKLFEPLTESFTKYEAHLYPSLWSASDKPLISGYHWVHQRDLETYVFSSGHKKILKNYFVLN